MSACVVIDASFALNLILPGTRQTHFQTLIEQWEKDGMVLYAPALWLYEITSALSKAVHFGDLTSDEGKRVLALVQKLGVQLRPPDDVQADLAFAWTMRLPRGAAYDSFYLALAEMLECELWTADKRLYNAAAVPWVHWAG